MLARLRRSGKVIAGLWLALNCSMALAQPAGAQGEHFLYRVMQGDTLGELSQRYTGNVENWRRLKQLNQIEDEFALPVAMLVRIPFALIPQQPSVARITHAVGEVRVDGSTAAENGTLHEGQSVMTGASGFVTLELADGSLLSVPPASELRVQRLRAFQGTGLIDVIVDMRRGTVESEVAPEQTGVGRFEVRTPVSVTGVRGTRLRVRAYDDAGARSEVLSGRANVETGQSGTTALGARQGVAVDASGRSSGARRLLDAPLLSVPARSPAGWQVDFPPVTGAQAYLVMVARDAQGSELVSRQRVTGPPVLVRAPGPGTHHVIVRAIDELGLEGLDGYQPFDGQPVLTSADGNPVASLHAGPVLLGEY